MQPLMTKDFHAAIGGIAINMNQLLKVEYKTKSLPRSSINDNSRTQNERKRPSSVIPNTCGGNDRSVHKLTSELSKSFGSSSDVRIGALIENSPPLITASCTTWFPASIRTRKGPR